MARVLTDSRVTMLAQGLVTVLFVAVLAGAALQFLASGLAPLNDDLLYVYLVAVVAVGVFKGNLDTPGMQLALGVGLAGLLVVAYLPERLLLVRSLLVAGGLLVVYQVYDAVA